MSELQQRFEQAQKDVVSLAERPQNAVLLKLYAYYKQAVDGDVSGDKPGAFDLVSKKKYAAWASPMLESVAASLARATSICALA